MIDFKLTTVAIGILLAIIGYQYFSGQLKDEKIQDLSSKYNILQIQWDNLNKRSEDVKQEYENTIKEVSLQNVAYKKQIIKLQNEKIPILCPDKFIWMKEKKEEFVWPN